MRYRVLLLVFIALWFLNWPVLSGMFDLESCMQQYKFFTLREVVYEVMFLILTVALFFNLAHLEKALACFISLLIAGSIVDKLLGVNSYQYGDIVLVVLSLIVSIIVWRRYRKK